MSFLLPGIYKPFYIEGLMVHTNRNTFFNLIDIHNGIGIYDAEKELYNIGRIKCDFIIQRNVGNTLSSTNHTSENTIIYREKPLFTSTYQDSINSVFSKTTYTYDGPIRLMGIEISYTPPSIESYGIEDVVLNRSISLRFETTEFYSRTYSSIDSYPYDAPFCLKQINDKYFNIYQGENAYKYNGKELSIDEGFMTNVKTMTQINYYVVNESFYKYFIEPEIFGDNTSNLYRTYNNGEIPNFTSGRTSGIDDEDVTRVFYDLFPHKLVYSAGYVPYSNKKGYDESKQCCFTTPFFRMYPQIKSNDPFFPLCCKVNYIQSNNVGSTSTPETLILNKPINSEENLSDVKFYLIGVKSPLTRLPDNLYTDALSGKQLKPEQDYITVIENYGRLKILSSDNTSLYTEEGVATRYNNTNDFRL